MTWPQFEAEVKKLAARIHMRPDVVIGIVRGGIIPARLLSSELNIKNMYCLTVKKRGKDREVTNNILENLNTKKILLVEDMLETGKSLITAKAYLEEKGARVKTACLYTMPISKITPDYFLKEIREVVRFPWE